MVIERPEAFTPPSFLWFERQIPKANRKYHSGWIWEGVTRGLAGIKWSGSPNKLLFTKIRLICKNIITINPRISLFFKNGWKVILSEFEFNEIGLLEPVCAKIVSELLYLLRQ